MGRRTEFIGLFFQYSQQPHVSGVLVLMASAIAGNVKYLFYKLESLLLIS